VRVLEQFANAGQVSDTGVVKGKGWELPVEDVRKVEGKQVVVGPYQGRVGSRNA
jgi:alanyl-tRNA synthetase